MKKRLILFFLVCASFSRCTWTPRTVLPDNFRVIYLNKFSNETLQPELVDLFTVILSEKFEMDGRLTVTQHVSKANGVLFCTITKYKKMPISYTYAGEVDTSAVTMGIKVQLRDIKTGSWLHDNYLEETMQFNLKSEPIETEIDVQKKLMDSLSNKIVSKVIEGW
ncbi:MAG: LPS assembly lipoprotein LptE [bacterium]|nr:LPS assembly lipoprotein LptE [bacterium]